MKELPKNHLNSKVKVVWRLNDALWLTALFVILFIPFVVGQLSVAAEWLVVVLVGIALAYVVCLVVWLGILPPIRYLRWRYELLEEYLYISKGIIWRKRYIIPFIRVQNTDTRQGPLLRAFGLASVTVATAAGQHEIPGLDVETAEQLRDKAAELARLAQEDV